MVTGCIALDPVSVGSVRGIVVSQHAIRLGWASEVADSAAPNASALRWTLTKEFDSEAQLYAGVRVLQDAIAGDGLELPLAPAPVVSHPRLRFAMRGAQAVEDIVLLVLAGRDLLNGTPSSGRGSATGTGTPAPGTGEEETDAADEGGATDAPAPSTSGAVNGGRVLTRPSAGVENLQDRLWESLDVDSQALFASRYFSQDLNRHDEARQGRTWLAAADMVLLENLNQADDPTIVKELYVDLIRARANLPTDDDKAANVKRRQLVDQVMDANKRVLHSMDQWLDLAKRAPAILVGTLLASIALVIEAFDLTRNDKLDGLALAVIVFVLALFAISPAVLLLLQRPLAGLDKWMPGSTAKAEGESEAASAADKPKKPEEKS